LFTQTALSTYKFFILYTTRKFFFHTYGTTQTERVRTQGDEENIWCTEDRSKRWIEMKFNEKLHNVSARHEISNPCRTHITRINSFILNVEFKHKT